MQKMIRNRSRYDLALFSAFFALLLTAATAFAAVPEVVVDAQLPGVGGFNSPQSIAMAPNNTYYVADTGNSRVVAIRNGAESTVSTPGFTLVQPQALAVDGAGDLFIGGTPATGTGRVIEAMATNGVLNGTARLLVSGGSLKDVTALAVDPSGTVYIGDDLSAAVYTLAPGSGSPVKLNAAGLPSDLIPTAILKDAAGDLFIADFNSTLYEIPAGAGSAQTFVIPGFTVWGPTGLALDPKGNLYVLTLTSTAATTAQAVPENIIEVPASGANGALDPAGAYMVPFTGPQNASGIAIDRSGTIYILDNQHNDIAELIYGSPVNFGSTTIGQYGPPVTVNVELNAAFQQGGFMISSKGDNNSAGDTTEAVNQLNTCQASAPSYTITDGSNGGPISASDPYWCETQWSANPNYPGVRTGTVQILGTGGFVLASTPYYETGIGASTVLYPLTATETARNLGSPVSLAVSGLDHSLYELDYGGRIFRINGPDGRTKTTIQTAPISLFTPTSIAVNDEGDLYVSEAAFGLSSGYIVVIPALKGETPYTFNPGNLLDHPISVAFDSAGNLFIGDSGPDGQNGDTSDPGYIVEVPAGGGPAFKLNTGGATIVYPESLAADPYTGELYVGDAGEIQSADAQVVRIPPGGGSAIAVAPFNSQMNPVAIVFDAAEQYYVLDQNANTITVVPHNGAPYSLPFDNSLLTNAASLAITNGSENLVVGNSPSQNHTQSYLVYLNGQSSTLNFGNVAKGQQSNSMSAFLGNVGWSAGLALGQPYYSASPATSSFYFLSTTTCGSGVTIAPASQCEMDLQFQPTTVGGKTQKLTFQTDGFLPNSAILTLKGRGTKPTATTLRNGRNFQRF